MRLTPSILALLASATTAAAEPWTDPSSVISLDKPAGWSATAHPTDGLTYVVASSATSECAIVGIPRAATAERTAYDVRASAETPIDPAQWTRIAGVFPELFPGTVTVESTRVDTEPFWPIQRAHYAVAGAPDVYAAIQFRPGLELWSLCRTSSGAADTAAFDALIRSIGTPQDAALQETAEQQRVAAEEHRRGAREFNIGERPPEHHYGGPDAALAPPPGSGPQPNSAPPSNPAVNHTT